MATIPPPKQTERPAPAPDRIQTRVDAAAFALMRDGRNPTVAAVRERMGGGSPNVVAPALQRWRHAFAGRLSDNASAAAEVLPPGVQELVEALWSRALFEAHKVAAESRDSSSALAEMGAAIRELKAATARIERREADLELLISKRSSRPISYRPRKKSAKRRPPKARPKPTKRARQQKPKAKAARRRRGPLTPRVK